MIANQAHFPANAPDKEHTPTQSPNVSDEYLQNTFLGGVLGYGLGKTIGALSKYLCKDADAILFGQRGISRVFRNGKFAGQTVEDVAEGLRSGKIRPDEVPVQFIERDGQKIAINNRSLYTTRLAGVKPVGVDVTGNPRFEAQLTERLSEMGGQPTNTIPVRGVSK